MDLIDPSGLTIFGKTQTMAFRTLITSILLTFLGTVALGQTDSCEVIAPNSLSINGGPLGQELHFCPDVQCRLEDYKLHVYNRWGSELFSSSKKSECWSAEKVDEGIYFWVVTGRLPGSEDEFKKSGSVTIIK